MRKITLGLLMLGVAACSSSSSSPKGHQDAGPADSGLNDSAVPDASPGQDGSTVNDGGSQDSGPAAPDLLGVDLAPTPQPSPSAGCGNGTREAGEQCDDGNNINLDGCDADCKFEQVQRFTDLTINGSTSTACPANQIGAALSLAAGTLHDQLIAPNIKSGTISVMASFGGLTNLTGAGASQSVNLGVFSAFPSPSPAGYDGTNDLDYWYVAKPGELDSNRAPTAQLPLATVGLGKVSAGPGNFDLNLGIVDANLKNATLMAVVSPAAAPLQAAGAAPPGHLASEHDETGLTTFPKMAGNICGGVPAADLYATQIGAMTVSNLFLCKGDYTATSTLLDLIVGGCSIEINAEQPDGPVVGTNTAVVQYTFTFDSTSHSVSGCTDNVAKKTYTPGTAGFTTCLANATYSVSVGFTADRVITRQ